MGKNYEVKGVPDPSDKQSKRGFAEETAKRLGHTAIKGQETENAKRLGRTAIRGK